MGQKQYAERDHEAQGEHYMRHLEAMTAEKLHSKSAIAGELAHRDIEIEKLRGGPGVKENADGSFTVKMASRAEQLDTIATGVQDLLERFGGINGVILPPEDAHKICGWMEQVGIISDELAGNR